MVAGVMSFGYHVPAWVLWVGLALVWLGGLAVTAPRRPKPADCPTCRRLAATTKPGTLNVAAYQHYMDAHYPRNR